MDLTTEQYRTRISVLTDHRPEGAGTLPIAWETPEQRAWEQDLLTLIFGSNIVDEEA